MPRSHRSRNCLPISYLSLAPELRAALICFSWQLLSQKRCTDCAVEIETDRHRPADHVSIWSVHAADDHWRSERTLRALKGGLSMDNSDDPSIGSAFSATPAQPLFGCLQLLLSKAEGFLQYCLSAFIDFFSFFLSFFL